MMVPQQQKPTSWGDITWIHYSTAMHSSLYVPIISYEKQEKDIPEEFVPAICIDAETLDVSLEPVYKVSLFHLPA